MKVHLIKVQSIERFVLENSQSKKSFEVWLSIVKRADWNNLEKTVKVTTQGRNKMTTLASLN